MQVGYEKIAIFDRYIASSSGVDGATVRYCKQSAKGQWQVVESRRW